ncbi:MAG: hypothetical protein QW407_03945 [Thermofilaceae archaeon]
MQRVTGYEVWKVSRFCGYCRQPTKPSEEYVQVGGDLFHEQCLEKLLRAPEEEFRRVVESLTLAARQELEKMRRERRGESREEWRREREEREERRGGEAAKEEVGEFVVVWVEPRPPGMVPVKPSGPGEVQG